MTEKSLRVDFVPHHDGDLTGHLMPRIRHAFAPSLPSAYGASEEARGSPNGAGIRRGGRGP